MSSQSRLRGSPEEVRDSEGIKKKLSAAKIDQKPQRARPNGLKQFHRDGLLGWDELRKCLNLPVPRVLC